MKRQQSLRPTLTNLECRWLPTVGPYSDIFRNAVQASYVAQADLGTNPVVFLGDSITYNWGTTTRLAPGSSTFSADFGPVGAANFGIIGDTTSELLGRIEGGDLDGKPKVAVVMIGVNDLYGGATPSQAALGVTSVVQAIRSESPNTQVLLLGVLPTDLPGLTPKVDQLDAMISGLSALPHVTYMNPGTEFANALGNAKVGLTLDGIHPSGAGYTIIGSAIDSTVHDLLNGSKLSTPTSTPTSTPSPPTSAQPTVSLPNLQFVLIPLAGDLDLTPDSSTSMTVDSVGKPGHTRSVSTI